MQTYRAHRSAFFLPPSDELRATLDRLIETDKSNQRVHKLRLAEIAWDRGDDAACLRLGQSAFNPNVADNLYEIALPNEELSRVDSEAPPF